MSVDLDREIDRAVREMLDVDARADLRARVIESIEQPSASRRWLWIAAPLAVAAVVVLAVILRPSPPQPRVVQSLPAVANSQQPAVTTPSSLPAGAGRHEGARVWRPPSAGSVTATATTVHIAPLAAPAPITVRPTQLRPLDQPEVAIAQLPDIAPISIEPLPGGRH